MLNKIIFFKTCNFKIAFKLQVFLKVTKNKFTVHIILILKF